MLEMRRDAGEHNMEMDLDADCHVNRKGGLGTSELDLAAGDAEAPTRDLAAFVVARDSSSCSAASSVGQ